MDLGADVSRRAKHYDQALTQRFGTPESRPADQQKVANLDRTAKQAAYRVKQERYRQATNRYNERMRTRKPGSKVPKGPKPPKPPQ